MPDCVRDTALQTCNLLSTWKHEHWHENDEQYQYMRPETLFGPKKFESYLQSATRWEQKGRPKRADWGAKSAM